MLDSRVSHPSPWPASPPFLISGVYSSVRLSQTRSWSSHIDNSIDQQPCHSMSIPQRKEEMAFSRLNKQTNKKLGLNSYAHSEGLH